jgi:hypothetical protein
LPQKNKTMIDKCKCTICGVDEDPSEPFMKGEIGMIHVDFCVWCLTGLIDMAEQLNPCECRDNE